MRRLKKFKVAGIFAAMIATMLFFQNCSNFENKARFSESTPRGNAMTGGGDTYDGKPDPGDYYRVIPDYKCANQPVVRDIIYVRPGSVRLSTINPSDCTRSESAVDTTSLQGSNQVREVLRLSSAVFEKKSVAPDLNDRSLRIVENWCSSDSGKRIDVVVRFPTGTGAGEILVVSENVREVLAGASRSVTGSQIHYSAAGFDMNVSAGTALLERVVNGQRVQTPMTCGAAGRLDPASPVTPLACPNGYLKLPGLAGYTESPFCMAKFEARASANGPQSTAAGLPAVNVSRDQAITSCQSLGLNYDLVSNAEWQSTARHIEAIPENWSGGVIGSAGGLSRGHSDNAPTSVLTASADDNQSCVGTGQTCSSTQWDGQRRTFRLGSGDFIWDLAGNADEWIKDTINQPYGPADRVSQMVNGGAYAANAKDMFGPAGNYLALNTAPFGGLGMSYLDGAGGAVRRGAGWQWNGVDNGGLFNVYLYDSPTFTNNSVSYRCVYHP